MLKKLTEAILLLTRALCAGQSQRQIEFEWFKSHLAFATKYDLKETERNIMSAISKFATDQAAFNTRQGAAIDSLVSSTGGLVADIAALNEKILELENSSGGVTPEDEALIAEMVTQGEALATKAEAVAAALAVLDGQTPPTPPPA